MFEEILIDFKEEKDEKDDNLRHKSDLSQTSLESIDYILDLINLDTVKILKHNRI